MFFEPYDVDPGVYFVDYTVTQNGCSYTKEREIEVMGEPIVLMETMSYEICRGDSIQPIFSYEGTMRFDKP